MSMNGESSADKQEDVVVRKAERGWVVGDENVADLTSAMVLADLFAADQADDETGLLEAVDENGMAGQPAAAEPVPRTSRDLPGERETEPDSRTVRPPAPSPWPNVSGPQRVPAVGGAPGVAAQTGEADEAARLAVTVAQLEHALASRVRVEQAIGVLAERHRLRPREAFDLLRKASRSRGQRVTDLAQEVVASTANPLLRLPDELSRKQPEPRPRGRSLRRGRHAADH